LVYSLRMYRTDPDRIVIIRAQRKRRRCCQRRRL